VHTRSKSSSLTRTPGSVLYPVIFRRLIEPVGFGWTTRVIGFVALIGLGLPLVVLRSRLPPPKAARSLVDLSAFREPPFVIFGLGIFCSLCGLYFPFFYLPTYFRAFLRTDSQLATYSVAILNAGSFFGRICPGFLADQFGSTNTIIPIALFSALLAFAWIGIRNLAGTIVYACLYGVVSGAMVSLPATVVATTLSPHMGVVGTRMGMTFLFGGLGLFIGNPIAGFSAMRIIKWKAGAGWKL
jgi:MFS family permease